MCYHTWKIIESQQHVASPCFRLFSSFQQWMVHFDAIIYVCYLLECVGFSIENRVILNTLVFHQISETTFSTKFMRVYICVCVCLISLVLSKGRYHVDVFIFSVPFLVTYSMCRRFFSLYLGSLDKQLPENYLKILNIISNPNLWKKVGVSR